MSNGKVIEEIRAILSEDGKISAAVRDRLILAALTEVYGKMEEYNETCRTVTTHTESIKRLEDRQKENRGTLIGLIVVFIVQVISFLWK